MRKPTFGELRDAIRGRGLRATNSRMAVLELLHGADQPISHAEVCTKLAGAAFDHVTLYRNLVDFAEVDLVRRSDVGDHVWRFALVRNDHNSAAHPHFVCTGCGVMQCLPTMAIKGPAVRAPRSVKRHEVEVHVRGLCDACS
jgi:Fur family ferric uptake transcriptional regulator